VGEAFRHGFPAIPGRAPRAGPLRSTEGHLVVKLYRAVRGASGRRSCPDLRFPDSIEVFTEAAIVKVCVLASSSSGNSTFIGTANTRILIDAGISKKATFERLQEIGEDPGALDAILITHEHSDHVGCLLRVARGVDKQRSGRKTPIYVTQRAAPTISWETYQPELREFQAGAAFEIGDLGVQSFTVPHDAADPVGYCFRTGGLKLSVVTDLGYIPDSVRIHVGGSDFMVLESNHDIEMLKVGPYPWQVKQRVMSRKGHLSNDLVSEYIIRELAERTQTLVLGHLSENNNHPEIVRVNAQQALLERGLDPELVVAVPRQRTRLFEL
jgi:phosphoribosyl 1,2-cyclic phosphodiesterase